jgi:hypothetical protein
LVTTATLSITPLQTAKAHSMKLKLKIREELSTATMGLSLKSLSAAGVEYD